MKTFRKPALISQLNTALNGSSFSISTSTLRDLRNRANELQVLSTKLESLADLNVEIYPIQETLMEIVTQAYELTLTSNLGAALGTSSFLDPTLKTFLPEAFGKLGRYYTAASELVSAARDRSCRVFLTVRIEPCHFQVLPENLTLEVPVSIYEVSNRLFQSSDLPRESLLRLGDRIESSLSRSEKKFQERIADMAGLGKIHAEIQLLFFYELHPKPVRPRVICSSKSACYLCNLFIQLHGQFFVPRTHGRLYGKWILPDWLEGLPIDRREKLGVIVTKLNSTIEEKIRKALVETNKPYLYPNESVLVARAHWPSTSDLPENPNSSSGSTSTLRQEATAGQMSSLSGDQNGYAVSREDSIENPWEENLQVLGNGNRTLSSSRTTISKVEHGLPETEPPTELSDEYPEDPFGTTSAPPAHSPHRYPPAPYQQLTRGKSLWKQLVDANNPLRISTKSIHATVSPTTDDNDDNISTNNHWVQLKWLLPDELPALDCDGRTVVHLKDLAEGAEMALRHVEILYLRQAQDVVSIKYCPRGPV
jgi:OTT_1508-like deaminase